MLSVAGAVVAFIFGLVVGSFLNVCIYRLPQKKSIISPASYCPHCRRPIEAVDNIPLVSYLLLRGRCRHCGAKISLRYPLVELATGLLFASVWLKFGLSRWFLPALFYGSVLILVGVIDLQHRIIPNKVVLPSLSVGLVLLIPAIFGKNILPLVFQQKTKLLWLDSLGGLLIGGGLLFLVGAVGQILFKREAMGGGDIKLGAFLGLFLGRYVLVALFLSFLVGAVVGLTLILLGKASRKTLLPFGPYLSLGGLVALFYGQQLWTFYLALY